MKPKTILLSDFIKVLKKVEPGTNGYADVQKTLPLAKDMLKRFGNAPIPFNELEEILLQISK